MRLTVLVFLLSSFLEASQPHFNHVHQHLHQVERRSEGQGPSSQTIVVYELNGRPISAAEVKLGIENGTLVWTQEVQNNYPSFQTQQLSTFSAYTSPTPTTSSVAYAFTDNSVALNADDGPQAHYQEGEKFDDYTASTASDTDDDYSTNNLGTGVNQPFPDGQLSCSTFPSQYGAIAVDWIGLDGWAGIQNPHQTVGAYADIETVQGGCCEQCFCSYACPPGKQKSQWPTEQGATGQSVGGIQCRNGKLHLTNPELSTELCVSGASQVTVQVQNKMQRGTAVCRTDYPGTWIAYQCAPLNSLTFSSRHRRHGHSSRGWSWQHNRTYLS